MEYNCCEYLLHQIVFDQFDIKPCCQTSMNKESAKFIDNFDGVDFDVEKYISERKKFIDMFKKGQVPACCKDCPIIKKLDWKEDEVYFDRIIMANIAKCSCNCIYCVYTHDNPDLKNFYNNRKPYDIKPILLKLRNNNLIKENFVLIIGGGECSEFSKGELEWLIYFTSSLNGKVQLLSSGIKYSKAIEQILKSGKTELSISPDAGTKKTYERIKRVKAFDRVWLNLKNYIIAAQNNKNALIEVKYIIIPSVNDNIREVKSFLKKCNDISCKRIHVDIENYWFSENKDKQIPDKIKKIIDFFDKQKGFSISYSIEKEYWLNKK